MKNEKVFAKGKDGHYRYMNKKTLAKKNMPLTILTILFYILVVLIVIGCGYFIYNDYLKFIFK